jgi:UDP-glucose 6-dehydrogenase
MKIGFIGQGFVGKNIADDFQKRGNEVIRYALEAEYVSNRELIAGCEAVFIAVPTPTTPEGFDYSIVEDCLGLVGEGKIAVLKSTLLPGTTKKIQDSNPNKIILFAPEFLCEATAAHDAAHPMFNIVGIPADSAEHNSAAEKISKLLPHSEHNFIVPAESAEFFKYVHNIHGFTRVILSNAFYDLADSLNINWSDIKSIMDIDPMMSPYYNSPVHKGGRGAGGNCFIKDMAAFRQLQESVRPNDKNGINFFKSMETINLELLAKSNKSQDLVRGVYGNDLPSQSNRK